MITFLIYRPICPVGIDTRGLYLRSLKLKAERNLREASLTNPPEQDYDLREDSMARDKRPKVEPAAANSSRPDD